MSPTAKPGGVSRFITIRLTTSRWIRRSWSKIERVEREVDGALDGVLDRHEAASASPFSTAASASFIDRVRQVLRRGEIGLALQRLFSEGRARAEESDACEVTSCVNRQLVGDRVVHRGSFARRAGRSSRSIRRRRSRSLSPRNAERAPFAGAEVDEVAHAVSTPVADCKRGGHRHVLLCDVADVGHDDLESHRRGASATTASRLPCRRRSAFVRTSTVVHVDDRRDRRVGFEDVDEGGELGRLPLRRRRASSPTAPPPLGRALRQRRSRPRRVNAL